MSDRLNCSNGMPRRRIRCGGSRHGLMIGFVLMIGPYFIEEYPKLLPPSVWPMGGPDLGTRPSFLLRTQQRSESHAHRRRISVCYTHIHVHVHALDRPTWKTSLSVVALVENKRYFCVLPNRIMFGIIGWRYIEIHMWFRKRP